MISQRTVAIIGGGPAGLMAAEVLAQAGAGVTIYDRMLSPGRKFLLAGLGGLNLTHSEPLATFLSRYGAAEERLRPAIEAFPPDALRAWCERLGELVFVGTSGRIFPRRLKASPLLRAWLQRLGELGVRLERGQLWCGWSADGELLFKSNSNEMTRSRPDAVVLALGGASWPKLGSDGGWVRLLEQRHVRIVPLTAANCGVRLAWSELFQQKYAGEPLKRIAVTAGGTTVRGEATVTAHGLEGGAIYQLIPTIREGFVRRGQCSIEIDLKPDLTMARLADRLSRPRGKQTVSNHLRKAAGLAPVAIGLLRETHGATLPAEASHLARSIKAVPLNITALEAIEHSISTAGGITWDEIDDRFMLRNLPGVFAAGEMLDWEAPTGGYLLQACFSTGVAAAKGVLSYLE